MRYLRKLHKIFEILDAEDRIKKDKRDSDLHLEHIGSTTLHLNPVVVVPFLKFHHSKLRIISYTNNYYVETTLASIWQQN